MGLGSFEVARSERGEESGARGPGKTGRPPILDLHPKGYLPDENLRLDHRRLFAVPSISVSQPEESTTQQSQRTYVWWVACGVKATGPRDREEESKRRRFPAVKERESPPEEEAAVLS